MSIVLSALMAVASLILATCVVVMVKRDRLQLRYSLIWLVLSLLIALSSLFPGPVFEMARLFGFETPSNFVFFTGFSCVLLIALSLSSIVSKQAANIKDLTQRIALLEHQLYSEKRGER